MSKKLNPHWASGDNITFFPRGKSQIIPKLTPGVYGIANSIEGLYFYKNEVNLGDLIRFDDETISLALKEVSSFWTKKELFQKHEFPFRRGILLYGPPGGGKTSSLKLLVKEIIDLGGIAINFQQIDLFTQGMKLLRNIERDTPIVVLMEDLDTILDYNDQSAVLNMLDGIGGFENIIFLATTNYIDKLEGRIKNRPSRFDRRFFIDFPNAKSRKIYLEHIIGKTGEFNHIDIDKWVADTDKFTPAHLKELFLSVAFFDNDYEEVLKRLGKMQSSSKDYDENMDKENDTYDEYDSDGNIIPPPGVPLPTLISGKALTNGSAMKCEPPAAINPRYE